MKTVDSSILKENEKPEKHKVEEQIKQEEEEGKFKENI